MEKLKDLIRKVARAIKRAFWFILAEDPCQEPRRGKHDPKPEPKKPKGKRFRRVTAVYKAEELRKDEDIVGHIYTLSCPVCGRDVKRSHEYCRDCGSRIRHKMEVSRIC